MTRWVIMLAAAGLAASFDVLAYLWVTASVGGQPGGTQAIETITEIAKGGDALVIRVAFLVLLIAVIGAGTWLSHKDLAKLNRTSMLVSKTMLLVVDHLRRISPEGSARRERLERLESELLKNGSDDDRRRSG